MNSHWIETFHQIIGWVAVGIELLAVAVIVAGVVVIVMQQGTVRYLFKLREKGAYQAYKTQLGKSLLLGLELLVAADMIRTVALEASLQNVEILGLLVVVRTFLSWSISVEIEGRWPWQPRPLPAPIPPGGRE